MQSILLGIIGTQEIIIILIVVLLIFGGRKIPELMKGLGKGIKEFKNASKEDDNAGQDKEKEKNKDKDKEKKKHGSN